MLYRKAVKLRVSGKARLVSLGLDPGPRLIDLSLIFSFSAIIVGARTNEVSFPN